MSFKRMLSRTVDEKNGYIIDLGLGNYYGDVIAFERNGKYYMTLENWDGVKYRNISEKLFIALKGEFGVTKADNDQREIVESADEFSD